MRLLSIAILILFMSTAGCSWQKNVELPVQFKFKSKRHYEEIKECTGMRSLIEKLELIAVTPRGADWSGSTYLSKDGQAKLSLSLHNDGTVVVYRAVKAPTHAIASAARACGS